MNKQTHTVSLIGVRAETNQRISQLARKSGQKLHKVYRRVYNQLKAFYGIDVHSFPRRKGETLLLTCERQGAIDKVYIVASSELLLSGGEGLSHE